MVYISFRQSLEYAVSVGILDINVSMKTKSIPKGKAVVAYWNKKQFEKVISQFCIDDLVLIYDRCSGRGGTSLEVV